MVHIVYYTDINHEVKNMYLAEQKSGVVKKSKYVSGIIRILIICQTIGL
jgi:hypothetical protein